MKLVTKVEDVFKAGVDKADEGTLKHYEVELKEPLGELKEADNPSLD